MVTTKFLSKIYSQHFICSHLQTNSPINKKIKQILQKMKNFPSDNNPIITFSQLCREKEKRRRIIFQKC